MGDKGRVDITILIVQLFLRSRRNAQETVCGHASVFINRGGATARMIGLAGSFGWEDRMDSRAISGPSQFQN